MGCTRPLRPGPGQKPGPGSGPGAVGARRGARAVQRPLVGPSRVVCEFRWTSGWP